MRPWPFHMTIEQFAVYQLNGNKKKRKKRRGKDPGHNDKKQASLYKYPPGTTRHS